MRSHLRYKDLSMVEGKIHLLEQTLQSRSFTLSEERKVVAEINDLNRSKKFIKSPLFFMLMS